jgi:hypothetical protein
MLPSLEAVLRAHAWTVRRFGLRPGCDEGAILEALRDARTLAGERTEDEPAALLFAFSRRARALASAWEEAGLLIAANHARKLGFELDLTGSEIALENLRLRVAWKLADYEELRAFIAARLRPLP